MKTITTIILTLIMLISTQNLAFSAWENITPQDQGNVIFFGVDFLDDEVGMAVGQDMATTEGIAVLTTDGGLSWQTASFGANTHLRAIGFFNTMEIVVGGYDGPPATTMKIISTTNGGQEWSLSESTTLKGINEIEVVNSNVAYTMGYGTTGGLTGGVLKTTNKGADWETSMTASNMSFNCIDFVDEDFGYIGATNFQVGYFLSTTNGGTDWNQITLPESMSGLHFFDRQNGIAIGREGYSAPKSVLKTTDYGSTWEEIATLDKDIKRVKFFDNNTGFAAGSNGKVFRTNDGGQTWTAEVLGTDENIQYINITGDYIYLSGRGGSVFRQKVNISKPKDPILSSDLVNNTIDFSTVKVDELGTFTFEISNDGGADLIIESFDLTDTDGVFELTSDVSLPHTITSKELELAVTFTPNEAGKTYDGTLTIGSNAKNFPSFDIALTGSSEAEAKDAILSSDLSNQRIDFYTVNVNATGTFTFKINNDGEGDLIIESFDEIDPDGVFALTSPIQLPYTILPESKLDVEVTFAPLETDVTYDGTLTVVSNAKNLPSYEIALRGVGGEVISVEMDDRYNGNHLNLSCYPNPISNESTISLDLKSEIAQDIKLYLIDNSGKVISEIAEGTITPGTSTYNLNATNYPTGMYYIVSEIFGQSALLPVVIEK